MPKSIQEQLHDREQRNEGADLDKRQTAAEKRGWTLPVSFVDATDGGPVPFGYTATLGLHVTVHGTDRADLLDEIEGWERYQASKKAEGRSPHIPESHPLGRKRPAQPRPGSAPSDEAVIAA